VKVVALSLADPPSKVFYRLFIIFTISELILNVNRSESLIRQEEEEEEDSGSRTEKLITANGH
jgi:hypothetical protein